MLASDVKTVSTNQFGCLPRFPSTRRLFGRLLVRCPLSLLSLLHPSYPLLPLLAARFPFETAIGVNGQVWIRAESITQTVALGRAIKEVDEGRVQADAIGDWVDKLDGVLAE